MDKAYVVVLLKNGETIYQPATDVAAAQNWVAVARKKIAVEEGLDLPSGWVRCTEIAALYAAEAVDLPRQNETPLFERFFGKL